MIRLAPSAHADLRNASRWYDDQKPGLGDEFLDDVDQIFVRVSHTPLQFPEVEPNVLRALLRRFPNAVYFVVETDFVEFIAVLHMHCDPETWRTRS